MSGTVYKYFLDGQEYMPQNRGDITIDYERVREFGSYQYVKSLGSTVNFDNSEGAFSFIGHHGDCQKISLTIKEFCKEFPKGIAIFDGFFTNRDCSFSPDIQLVKVEPKEDSLYKCLIDNFDRNFNFLDAETIVSSTHLVDVSQFEYAVGSDLSFTAPKPFYGLGILGFFGILVFARELQTTYCQGGQPQTPAQGTGIPWEVLVDNCEGRQQTTWFRKPESLNPANAALVNFDLTACSGAGCTPPSPIITGANEVWVLMQQFDVINLSGAAGSISFWIDEHSIPVTPVEINNGRLFTDVVNLGLNKHCAALDLQSQFLFNSVNPVTGDSPSSTQGLQVHAISDVKDPPASEEATREDVNLKDLLQGYIEGKVNCFWRVDEGTKRLIIEHYQDLNNQGIIDIRPFQSLKNEYDYNNSDNPKAEEFPSLDSSIDFTGVDINYDKLVSGADNACATGKKSYITDKFYSEVDSIRVDPDSYPRDGVVIITPDSLAPPGSLNTDGDPIGLRAKSGVITGNYLANAPQAMANLHEKFWKFYRPFAAGQMNFINRVFDKVRPVKQLQAVEIDTCCFFLFAPTSAFVGNVFDSGQLVSSSFSLATGKNSLKLEYNDTI